MGIFLSCCGGGGYEVSEYNNVREEPLDQEERRRQMAEAAEARMKAQDGRGVKDPAALRERQRKAEEIERRQEAADKLGDNTLRWQMN